jgi:N-acetylneuraminate synthase
VSAVLSIDEVAIGPGEPVYVIAELSANHGGRLETAVETIRLAAHCGASAVKLQTYRAETMTLDIDQPPFVLGAGSPWAGRRLFELYEEAATPWEWHETLFAAAADCGITCFSSPFDTAAIDLLESLGCPAYKIASFELGDLALIRAAAATGKPLIMSTGMASRDEIDEAVDVAREAGASGVALLRCNSSYPAPVEEMDLATIPDMVHRWGGPVGLSDHTLSNTAAISAVTLGAALLEKHFIIRRSDGGPDAAFSIEPDELVDLVGVVEDARCATGEVRYGPSPAEAPSTALRRSLWIVADVAAGEVLTASNVKVLRPAGGLAPKHLEKVIGRRANVTARAGTPLTWDLLE